MFCPRCKSEYRPGFTTCADCGVELVDHLQEDDPGLEPRFVAYTEVLSTFNVMDIALVKSLLDSERITYFFHGENFNRVRPLALPARLMVKKDQVACAKEILKDLDLCYTGLNLGRRTVQDEEA